MSQEVKLEENRVYETNMKELIKVVKLDEENDKIHFYNITLAINQHLPLSRVQKDGRIKKFIR